MILTLSFTVIQLVRYPWFKDQRLALAKEFQLFAHFSSFLSNQPVVSPPLLGCLPLLRNAA